MIEEEIRIRRHYIPDDEVWERSHNTWKQLKPRLNFNYRLDPSNETPLEYSQRIISISGLCWVALCLTQPTIFLN